MNRSLLRTRPASWTHHAPPTRAGFLAIGLVLLASVAWAQLPTAQLTAVFPPGGRVGTTVEVRTAGADQDEVSQLVFSHPGIKAAPRMTAATELEKAKPQPGLFDVQIAGDVPPGIYEARVVGRFGVSNARAFVVGVYNESKEPGGNNQPANAFAVALDTTLSGTADANQVDYFKLPLKAAQRVIIDCLAQRIDSRLDGTLVVYDPAGKELARERDTIGSDPRLDFTAAADGEYRVAVFDFTYRGGGEYFYRLTFDVGPHIDFIDPPSGLPGSNNKYTVYGRNLPGGQPAEGVTVNGIPLQKLEVQIPLPGDEAVRRSLEVGGYVASNSALTDGIAYRLGNSYPALVSFAKAPVVREVEPNSQPGQAQLVTFPCEVTGRFYPAQDVDYFAFQAKKGEVYDIEVISHQLGLLTDPIVAVQKVKKNDKGEEVIQDVAQVDDPGDRGNRIGSDFDTSTDDPDYRLTADEDVIYRVSVRDQFGASRNDPRLAYRLAIHRGEPDFRIVAVPQPLVAPANNAVVPLGGVSVRKGGSTAIDVRIEPRYGFAGDIEILVEGLPAGVTCPSIVLSAAARTGTLIVTAAENAAAWAGSIRVVGKSKVGDKEVVRTARAGAAVWNVANRQQERVSFRVTRDLVLGVIDREMLPVMVQVAEDKVWETSRGGKLEIPIRVTRRGDYKEDLNLAPNNVPNELKPPNLTIKGAEAEGKLQLAATNGNLKPGFYSFYLRADSKLKHVRNPDAVAAAEQDQKDHDALIAQLTAKSKEAAEMKANAPKLVQEAMNGVKVAEQAKVAAEAAAKQAVDNLQTVVNAITAAKEAAAKDAANKALADAAAIVEKAKATAEAAKAAADKGVTDAQQKITQAQAAVKAAQDAMAAADKAAVDADAKVKAAQGMKAAVDKRVADAKAANNPKDLQFAVVSTPIKVRIVDTCLQLTAASPSSALKPEAKLELPIKVERLYGFDDQVEVTLEIPGGAKGLSANKLTLAKGQSEGKLEVSAAKDSAVGDQPLTVRAKAKFNNIELQATQPVTIKVEAAAQ